MTIKKLLSILLAFCVMFCMISIDTTPAYADASPTISLYSGVPASTTELLTPGTYYAAVIETSTFVESEDSLSTKAIKISQAFRVSDKQSTQSIKEFYITSGGAWENSANALNILTAVDDGTYKYDHTSSASFIYSVDHDGVTGVFDGCGGILVYDDGWYYNCAGGYNKNKQANIYTQSTAASITISAGSINVVKKYDVYYGDSGYEYIVSEDDMNISVGNVATLSYELTNTAISASNRDFSIRIYNYGNKAYVEKKVRSGVYVNLPTGAGFTTKQTSSNGSITGFAFNVATRDGYETAVVSLDGDVLTPTTTSSAFDSYKITNYTGTTDPAVTIECKKIVIPPVASPVVHVTPVYPISKVEPNNGTIALDKSFPSASDRVTITPTPDQGFLVSGVTVTTRSGKEVPVTANPDGTYSFISPSEAVEIDVDFVPEETELDKVTKKVNSLTLIAKSSKTKLWGKKAINLTWKIKDASGAIVDVDGVEVYRATAPYKNYKLRCIAKRGFYKNNQLNLNKKYRYKVRGYIIVDNEKVYTNWSNITVNGYKK